MTQYTTYLFDWDGTLGNSTEVWLEAMQANLAPHGLELPRETLVKTMGDWNDLVQFGLPESALRAYHNDTRDYAIARLPDAPLYEDAREMLARLRAAGKRLGVVTAAYSAVIQTILQAHNLTSMFDVVVCADDVKKQKPHPEGIQLAMQKLGVKDTQATVMIGDTDRDLRAGAAAGLDCILFHPENAHTKLEHITNEVEPVAVVRSWKQFGN